MMFKKILLFIFLASFVISTSSASENKAFDDMCDLIQEVMKLDLKPQARFNYISKHFDSRVGSKDVKEAYDLVFQVNIHKRYHVFKQAVESTSGQSWTCPALKEFFK